MIRLWIPFFALCLAALPAGADTDPADLSARAAEMLEQAGFGLLEADSAEDRVAALTDTVRAYEGGLAALREGIRQAALRERTILVLFEAERDRLASLLSVLQSIDASDAPVPLLHPSGPLGTARASLVLSEVTPAVARDALALRRQLEELTLLRGLQDDALARLSEARDQVQLARSALGQAIEDRGALPTRLVEDAAAMQRLIDSVDSLESLSAALAETTPRDDSGVPGFDSARGDLGLPVLGTPLHGFGETGADGITRPGVVLASRPRALVTAPWPATVRYAGPLLDYGNVIILEPDGDYLIVLAGLGELYAALGELVMSGAALGLMPGDAPENEELVTSEMEDAGAGLTERLYIEVRADGSPVDPGDWFAALDPGG